jgi:hypothetical protein
MSILEMEELHAFQRAAEIEKMTLDGVKAQVIALLEKDDKQNKRLDGVEKQDGAVLAEVSALKIRVASMERSFDELASFVGAPIKRVHPNALPTALPPHHTTHA